MFSPLMTRSVAMTEPNHSARSGKVNRLIIHHTTGGTLDYLTNLFRASKRTANRSVSVTYVLTPEGKLIGFVPENRRPWTSGGAAADGTAVTVEVMTFPSNNYTATAAQMEMLAKLAADLSNRYGWGALNRTNVRGHQEFYNTSCPGPYIWPRMDQIVDRANIIRAGAGGVTPQPTGNYRTTASQLNVRTGPGTNHRSVGTVPAGTVWYGTGKRSGDWVEGRTQHQQSRNVGPYWVHRSHLRAA